MPFQKRSTSWLPALTGATVALLAGCASAPTPSPAVEHSAPAAPVVAPETQAQEHKNTLRWKTASEVDNFGFDVYRGDSEEGPFERLTESPIEGAGTTDLTSNYSYEDAAIDPYREYFYYVESISLQGIREDFTPIIRAKPKLPASAEGDSTEAAPADHGDDS